ncbi:MAG: hypothetical protein WCW35_08430 [Bacteroidota bacterium]
MNYTGAFRALFLNSAIFVLVILLGMTTVYAQPSMKIKKNDSSYTNIKISEIDTITFGYSVGDTALGGVVVYVDATGWHGLVAAQTDETIGEIVVMPWSLNYNYNALNASPDGLYSGYNNTNNIVFYNQQSGIYAAYYCYLKTSGGYTDWYLPSKYELNLLFVNRAVIGGFSPTGHYWSSTSWPEWPESKSWAQFFYDGGYGNGYQFDKDQTLDARVRAVRAF